MARTREDNGEESEGKVVIHANTGWVIHTRHITTRAGKYSFRLCVDEFSK